MKEIIVTGACGGLGKAIVKRLIFEGYDVWAVARDIEQLDQCFAGIDCNGLHKYACNLSEESELITMVKTIVSQTGTISGLVHCAGLNRFIPLHLIKQKQMEEMFKIHVYAAITLCSLLSKKGNASAGCSVVLFSSVAAHEGSGGNAVYASAKAAVEGFVRSSAQDFVDRKIRINALVPGDVDSGMFHKFMARLTPEQVEERKKKYPLGFGSSENIADLVEFLISEKSAWITGQCYVIDGGHLVMRS